MTQKAKTIFMVVMMTVVLVVPVFNAHAAGGLNVCGDPQAESAAVEKLYNLRRSNFQTDEDYNNAMQAALNDFQKSSCQLSDIFRQIARITNFLIGAVGLFVVFRLASSGFDLIASYGNEQKIKAGKEGIGNAIIGLVIVLVAFAVVNTLFYFFQVQVGGSPNISFPFNPFGQ